MNNRQFPADWLDGVVFSWIRDLVVDHTDVESTADEECIDGRDPEDEILVDIERVALKHQKTMEYKIGLYLSGVISIEELDQHHDEIEKTLIAVEETNAWSRSNMRSSVLSEKDYFISLLQPDSVEVVMDKCLTDLASRKKVVDSIDVVGILKPLNGRLVAQMTCQLGSRRFSKKAARKVG